MKRTLIVGVGNIGSRLYKEYSAIRPDRYDPYKGIDEKNGHYDLAFICVDTPMLSDGRCDLRQVETAIRETEADTIVLRSTVPPGTTDDLIQRTGQKIVFSPEFYGTTQHCDEKTFDFNFTILGGNKQACDSVVQVLQEVYDARHRFSITDAKTAELAKYMENTFLAAKVSLCIQFWEIAQRYGINYAEMRELWLQDERFNRSHSFVYADHPFWTSHCFDKDLTALTKFTSAPLVQHIIDYNEYCKQRYQQPKEMLGIDAEAQEGVYETIYGLGL